LKQALDKGGLLAQRQNVDYDSSPAIPSDMGTHVYLNRRDRFVSGFLGDDEAQRLAEEMREDLLAARDAVDGGPVVKAVHLREDVFDGEEVAQAPDIVVEYENRYTRSTEPLRTNPGLESGHVPEGILLVWGPGVASGQIRETDIVHVAPTVLHLLAQPVPVDMDGQVATAALSLEWMARHPVQFDDRPATTVSGTGSDEGYTPDQIADVEAQLRSLGYIE
jgi:predicted AlkP superfamily phosphohydrolase/phosphomutase